MKNVILGICCLLVLSQSCLAQDEDYETEIRVYRALQNAEFRDPQKSPLSAEQMENFIKHDFFPIDEAYKVNARFEATPDARPFPMSTSTGGKQIYRRLGILHFELNGKPQTLEAYLQVRRFMPQGQKEIIFLPVVDLTNGNETYGAGRYLHFEGVPQGTTWTIDFNKLYNPYCAYNDKYECPLVPEANHLDLKVKAGVKDYRR